MKQNRDSKNNERPAYFSVDPATVDFFISFLRLSPAFWDEVLDISCQHTGRRMGMGKLRSDGRIKLEIECKDCDYVETLSVEPTELSLWQLLVVGFRSGQVDSVGWDLPQPDDADIAGEGINPEQEETDGESGVS